MTPTVLIVGGGFSGVTVTHALSRLAWPGGVRVVLADRSGSFGCGAAYSTDHPAHLLNVPAGRMGALANDEGHFLSWLRREDPNTAGDAFVPRSRYGDYLQDLLETARGQSAANVTIETLADQVVALEPVASGALRATLRSGATLDADRVVLAIGNLPPRTIPGVSGDDDRCVLDPWAPGALKRIRGISSALMVGTGLTMVDAVLLLHEANPGAQFVAVSRRGLLPLAHRDHHPTKPGVIDPAAALAAWNGSALDLLRIVRRESRRAEEHGQDWRDVLNGLRSITPQLWRRMPPREQARFFRHVRPFWDAHRHRMSTRVAARVQALMANDQLSIVAGRIAACARDGSQVAVDVRGRDGGLQRYVVDTIVNCTGPDGDLSRSNDPLVAALRVRGAIAPDALGIGIDTGDDGAVVDAKGNVSGVLFTLGATRRPALWESTAVPELREQAGALARRLHASLHGAG
jgi:uncharacterized NAD(P)/FAD-binding protein YdhS